MIGPSVKIVSCINGSFSKKKLGSFFLFVKTPSQGGGADNIVVVAVLIIIDFDYENEEFGGFNVEMGNGSEFL